MIVGCDKDEMQSFATMNLMVMSTLLEKLIRAFMTICLVSGREVGCLINTGGRPRVQQTGLLNSTYTGFSKLSHR